MVFSSLVFLCIFLPVVFLLYLVIPGISGKNLMLLLASLVFYAYEEPLYIFLMLFLSLCDYLWALAIQKVSAGKRILLAFAIVENLGILGIYKYLGFLIGLFNDLTGLEVAVPALALPIGISFFTFQAMSYVIDVYRSEVTVQRNYGRVLLYISFFPQLIAGPIVKYHDIEKELTNRTQSWL